MQFAERGEEAAQREPDLPAGRGGWSRSANVELSCEGRDFDTGTDVEAGLAFEAAMPSERSMVVGSMVNSQSGDHAILRLFCPTCQTSSLAGLESCRTKFFNDFYFAWGCFRVFLWSVPKE